MLTQSNIVPYLLEYGFLSTKSIVDGHLVVLDTSRRNRNFKVTTRDQGFFLKQGVDAERIATIAQEAAVYQLLQLHTPNDGLNIYLPQFYGYDPKEHILILELMHNTETLREYHTRTNRFSIASATAVGEALGTIHRQANANTSYPCLSGHPPWVLAIHHPDIRTLRDISSANMRIVRIIQQVTQLCELLDELRRGWRSDTFIHHDFKWDNCLVSQPPVAKHAIRPKIVDWEVAGVGDPCWDVGSVFNEYLSCWLFSIPITGETPPEQFVNLARLPLEKMQPAIRSFWQSYSRRMELAPATSAQWLQRSIKYAAARLVQTCFESMQMSIQLTGNIICLLQLSLNIMRRPQEAIVHLLGIPSQ
jgi:thiamine kinase-like enzyme